MGRRQRLSTGIGLLIGLVTAALIGPGLGAVGCSGDMKTGIWIRIISPRIAIDQVSLQVFPEGDDGAEPLAEANVVLPEAKKFEPLSENPENQLWILVLSGKVHRDTAVRIEAVGYRDGRHVAEGDLLGLQFRPNKVYDAPEPVELNHTGEDLDQDGFYSDDCDDTDPQVHPEQQEFCGDGLDNNCADGIDEGCPCAAGEQRECWPHWADEPAGPPCQKGIQTCDGTWGACEGMQLPNPEKCDDGGYDCFACIDMVDNDCDGRADGLDTGCGGCEDDTYESCYTGPPETANRGVCRDGLRTCIDGTWGLCQDEVLPNGCTPPTEPGVMAECGEINEAGLCNLRDDDCDGIVDNVIDRPTCSFTCGVCQGARQNCVDGVWVDCDYDDYEANARERLCTGDEQPLCCQQADLDCYAEEETQILCDSKDNDCDCQPDVLPAGQGECQCFPGVELPCPVEDDPSTPEYEPTLGICEEGVFICEDNHLVPSQGCVTPEVEICDDLDNNCDGTVDRHPQANAHCQENPQPNAVLLECNAGICIWNCDRDGQGRQSAWDLNNDRNQPGGSQAGDGCEYVCTQTEPANEVCDGQDNDCDGLTDGQDQVSIAVLCPTRTNASATQCEAPRDCDYTCDAPYGDCNGDLDQPIPLPGEAPYAGNGCETNLSNNPSHCGQCGTACDTQELCVAGGCSCGGSGPDCTSPDICCGTACYDALADEQHCGDCVTTCDQNESCESGQCRCGGAGSDCSGAQTNFCCDTECVNLNTDERYCGDCATACDPNEECQTGQCRCGGSGPNCTGATTNYCCGTECVNLNTDERFCGDCGTSCDTNESCESGQCRCGGTGSDCSGAQTDFCCGTQCVNLRTSIGNCGACGNTCTNAHGTTACSSAVCSPSCSSGWGDCDGDPDDGCEENIWETTDCGTNCGNRVDCTAQVDHASGTNCNAGACDYSACNTSYGDCDGNRANGCETSLWQTSSCGTTCGNRVNCTNRIQHASGATCSSGACDYSACNSGYGDCNADRTDGCETDIWQAASCGTNCGNRVDCTALVQHANAITCSSGACDYGTCQAGWGDCDGNRTNGCETNIWQTSSCGTTCGNRLDCSAEIQHASGATCSSGACDYTSCDAGWGNCDGDRTDGCEHDIWQTADCGSNCVNGVDCNTQVQNASGITCSTGDCNYTACDPGFADCDADRTNGCEVDLTDPATCGLGCGSLIDCTSTVQHAGSIGCAAGSCTWAGCDAGWDNCDANPNNGCEQDIWQTDDCGSDCFDGVDCTAQVQHATGTTCSSGDCDYGSCSAGWGDCDGDRTNGCEHDIWQTADCGTTCGNGVDCAETMQNASGLSCPDGSCSYTSCDGGFGDCDGSAANGCEEDIWSVGNCGTDCTTVDCNTTVLNASGLTCATGTCGYTTCDQDWDDCDADASNGCEQALTANPNCGSCGNDCGAGDYDKACILDAGTYRCGCNDAGDCGGIRPTCNNGQHLCQ